MCTKEELLQQLFVHNNLLACGDYTVQEDIVVQVQRSLPHFQPRNDSLNYTCNLV